MTKYIIENVDDERLCLKIFGSDGGCLNIIEGPRRFIMQWAVSVELGRKYRIRLIK